MQGSSTGLLAQLSNIVGDIQQSATSFTLKLFADFGCGQSPTNRPGCNGYSSWDSALTGRATRAVAAAEPLSLVLTAGGLLGAIALRRRGAH